MGVCNFHTYVSWRVNFNEWAYLANLFSWTFLICVFFSFSSSSFMNSSAYLSIIPISNSSLDNKRTLLLIKVRWHVFLPLLFFYATHTYMCDISRILLFCAQILPNNWQGYYNSQEQHKLLHPSPQRQDHSLFILSVVWWNLYSGNVANSKYETRKNARDKVDFNKFHHPLVAF